MERIAPGQQFAASRGIRHVNPARASSRRSDASAAPTLAAMPSQSVTVPSGLAELIGKRCNGHARRSEGRGLFGGLDVSGSHQSSRPGHPIDSGATVGRGDPLHCLPISAAGACGVARGPWQFHSERQFNENE